ncbi:MAG: NADH:ubiquinone reductase (Na(+)-transporting) subunit C [Muribaculaceae bacterium]|nr:NADH:ubiquinone reductase (Na(+)-transporting) subunit C [Muribaculaceae bacterium]
MNKNSNTYQIVYAAIMVLLVGSVLAFVYMALKPKQDENIANDKRAQILSAINIESNEAELKDNFNKYIVADYIVDDKGEIADSAANSAFNVNMKSNIKQANRVLPVYKSVLADGQVKYILPVYGAGLWGPIWGYVAVNDDGNTIFGTSFSHEGETPGLGARITENEFKAQFVGKKIMKEGAFKSVEVVKKGQKSLDGADYVDAISGATITSRGVGSMIAHCLSSYEPFLKKLAASNNQLNSQEE